jgi:hypothetical protein
VLTWLIFQREKEKKEKKQLTNGFNEVSKGCKRLHNKCCIFKRPSSTHRLITLGPSLTVLVAHVGTRKYQLVADYLKIDEAKLHKLSAL